MAFKTNTNYQSINLVICSKFYKVWTGNTLFSVDDIKCIRMWRLITLNNMKCFSSALDTLFMKSLILIVYKASSCGLAEDFFLFCWIFCEDYWIFELHVCVTSYYEPLVLVSNLFVWKVGRVERRKEETMERRKERRWKKKQNKRKEWRPMNEGGKEERRKAWINEWIDERMNGQVNLLKSHSIKCLS